MKKNPISNKEICKIYTDGACSKNGKKGLGSWAYIICNEKNDIVEKESGYLGLTTNNRAEYNAIINALSKAINFTRGKIELYSDSQLAINQINKIYRVKDKELNKLYRKVSGLLNDFQEVKFNHVPRENEYIKIVDKLCKDCLSKNLGGKIK